MSTTGVPSILSRPTSSSTPGFMAETLHLYCTRLHTTCRQTFITGLRFSAICDVRIPDDAPPSPARREGSPLCRLFGATAPFDQAKLASLYPTRRAFASAFRKALGRAVKARWIPGPDTKLMKKWAAQTSGGDAAPAGSRRHSRDDALRA
jgi:hypothetical protein